MMATTTAEHAIGKRFVDDETIGRNLIFFVQVAFYVSVLSATLIVFWFCTMRGPIIGKPYPQLPELPAQGEGQPTVQPAPGEPYLTYLLFVKQHVLNAIKDGSLENDRHPNMQPDGTERITSVNFLIGLMFLQSLQSLT